MQPTPLGAVIFDMDGVLVDSEPIWQEVEIELFGRLGVALDVERCRQTMGLRVDEVVAHWRARVGWLGPSDVEVVEQIVDAMAGRLGTVAQPLPGVRQAIARCAARGVRLALASSSRHRLIDAVLRGLDLATAFSVVCSAEDERWGKPHPGIFLRAAERLGVDPTACLVVEDSVNGVMAAKAARMACIAVPAPGEIDPRMVLADLVLPSLDALDDGVLDRFGAPAVASSR